MKILYAIQGTGNGHLARAQDVIPALQRHGELDLLVSGYQSDLQLPLPVKYRPRGLSFIFGKTGGIDITQTLRKGHLLQLARAIKQLPIKQYDLVVNDFEPIAAWAAKRNNIPCLGLSHQAAVVNPASPKPQRAYPLGKAIMGIYAPTSCNFGFHFQAYDPDNMSTPVVRRSIRELEPEQLGHYSVYLPAYHDSLLVDFLAKLPQVRWHVFSKTARRIKTVGNVKIIPVSSNLWHESLRTCTGVACGGGFETPSEALHLGKKLLVVPMKGQYEQQCNGAALEAMGVPVLASLGEKSLQTFTQWLASNWELEVDYPDETTTIVDRLFAQQVWEQSADKGSPSTVKPEPAFLTNL